MSLAQELSGETKSRLAQIRNDFMAVGGVTGPGSPSVGRSADAKKLAKQPFRLCCAFVGEFDRFLFAGGSREEAFLVQPVHGSPIEGFPHALMIVQTKPEERQH